MSVSLFNMLPEKERVRITRQALRDIISDSFMTPAVMKVLYGELEAFLETLQFADKFGVGFTGDGDVTYHGKAVTGEELDEALKDTGFDEEAEAEIAKGDHALSGKAIDTIASQLSGLLGAPVSKDFVKSAAEPGGVGASAAETDDDWGEPEFPEDFDDYFPEEANPEVI